MKRYIFISSLVLFILAGCSEGFWYNKHLRDTYGDYEQKLEDFNEAIENDPENAGLYLQRAKLLKGLEQVSLAKEDLNRAIELDPNLAEAYYLRGIIRFERGFMDTNEKTGAQSDMDKAVALGYENCDVRYTRGFYKNLFMKDHEGAYDEYTRAITIDPECAHAYYGRGSVQYYYLKRTEEALDDLAEARRLFRKQGDRRGYKDTEELISFIKEMRASDKLLEYLNKME